jgi:hypothetical protein
MGVGSAVPNPPVTGQPVASAWGNYISTHVVQAYASKAALDAGWPDAQEGAVAVTTDTFRLWQRRGGIWAPALSGPLGIAWGPDSTKYADNDRTIPAGWQLDVSYNPVSLLVDRLYQVVFALRVENRSITTGGYAVLGGQVAASGTGADVPLENGGSGQAIALYGWSVPAVVGAAWRNSLTGYFRTVKTTGQNASTLIPVTFWHHIIGTAGTWRIGSRILTVTDLGPSSAATAV